MVFYDVLRQHVEREYGVFDIREIAIYFHDSLYISFRDGKDWGFYVLYDEEHGFYVLKRFLPFQPPILITLVPDRLPVVDFD